MKNIKKLLSIVMVLTLVLALGASAFAANVTIEGAKDDLTHTYVAYQIFAGDNQAADEGAIGNLKWGADFGDGSLLVQNLKKSDLKEKFNSEGITETAPDAAAVAKAIGSLSTDELKAFAKIALASKVGTGTPLVSGTTQLGIGYYVIEDTTSVDGRDAVKNEVVLEVTQDVTVTFKTDKPSVQKKVKDVNDSHPENADLNGDWQDSADYDIGDVIPFQLKATIPANTTTAYETYKLIFHDTQSEGLTLDADSIVVKINDTAVAKGLYELKQPGTEADCTFEVVINDIKTLTEGFNPAAQNVITVEYNATLNDKAKIGTEGNPNQVVLEFSNDSTSDGTGKTPEDKVIVFTYDLSVNKVDGEGNDLEGADFSLFKKVADGYTGAVKYVNLTTGEIKDTLADGDTGFVKCAEVTLEKSNTLKEPTAGKFNKFYGKGLDDGDYVIVETATPAGFNSIAPQQFTVSAEHEKESQNPTLTKVEGNDDFKFTLSPAEGAMGQAQIENLTGLELPSTGGIGTTIFYVVGGILVAAAVILLVTKRRVSGTEK